MYVCMYVCTYVCTHVCMCMYVCMYVCMYAHIYLYTYICMYACLYGPSVGRASLLGSRSSRGGVSHDLGAPGVDIVGTLCCIAGCSLA